MKFKKYLTVMFLMSSIMLSISCKNQEIEIDLEHENKNTNEKLEVINSEETLDTVYSSYPELISNNRDYDWYIDQGNTGEHSNSNCGPASVTMAIKWANESFEKTTEDAREKYVSQGGWWTIDEIENYLIDNNINFHINTSPSELTFMDELLSGNILLLCMNTTYITKSEDEEGTTGRFYDYSDGHFLIVKGYKIEDDKVFFEVYDPNNFNKTYTNGDPKGKDRYYESQELLDSVLNWWSGAFVISEGLK